MPRTWADPRAALARWGRITTAGLLLMASGLVWGCAAQAMAISLASSQATRAPGSSSDAIQAASAVNAFGLDLYRGALGDGGNGVFSPMSVAMALSMAQAGARGETAAQMDKVLHSLLGSGSRNGLNSLLQSLAGDSGAYLGAHGTAQKLSLRIANAPFAQAGMAWESAYLDTLASRYGASLRLVDYKADSDGACRAINSWVSDQTEARIPHLLAALDPSTRLVLVNAIYLKAPWFNHFEEDRTSDRPFTRPDGSSVSVPTMAAELPAKYGSGPGWQAVEIPYINFSLAMTIIVPTDLTAFEKGFDTALLGRVTGSLEATAVDLTMPKFKVETKSELSSALEAMGMPLAFDASQADFSGMTTQARLAVSQVVHQANISVDEQGTEAAAAAAAVIAVSSSAPIIPVEVHVDRPFIFAVRDTSTGAIVFLGRVTDPSA
jgi:serine protease inhibitor